MFVTLSSDGKVITTIASAHCDGGAETTAIAPVGDQRRAGAGEAGDAVELCGLDGFGEGHRRQDGGQPPGQHRLARPGRADEEDIMGRTPASRSALHPCLELVSGITTIVGLECGVAVMTATRTVRPLRALRWQSAALV